MYKIINKKKLIITAIADTVGKIVSFPFTMFRAQEPIDPASVRSILVIRTAYLGDALMTLPMLKPLRERFTGASIAFLTADSSAPALAGNAYIDEVIPFTPFWFYPNATLAGYFDFIKSFRKRRFDLVIEARGDIREIMAIVAPARARYKVSYDVGGGGWLLTHVVPYTGLKHKVEYHLDIARYLGCIAMETGWGVRFTPDEIAEADRILAARGIAKPFALVHPGSRLELKMWKPERYAELITRMTGQLGMNVALLGHPSEKAVTDAVMRNAGGAVSDLTGYLTVRQLMAVISRAGLLVCNDSGPMHMAAAVGTPVAAVFGPSKSVETGPYGVKNRVVEKDFPCRRSCDESSCKYPERGSCMDAVAVDDVFKAVKELGCSNDQV
ncbi:MAG: glycosyltransferase family 9 protein [Nitrospinae bacterium]|nr:glycosyltransferase family 9 protein [Nitrospinota bacterium]